jgi:hypothetical protein
LNLYHFNEIEDDNDADMVVSMELSSTQLQQVLPVTDTNWDVMISEHVINLVTFKGSLPAITSNEPATCEYVIVVVSGAAVACWTTDELYQKLLAEKAYA